VPHANVAYLSRSKTLYILNLFLDLDSILASSQGRSCVLAVPAGGVSTLLLTWMIGQRDTRIRSGETGKRSRLCIKVCRRRSNAADQPLHETNTNNQNARTFSLARQVNTTWRFHPTAVLRHSITLSRLESEVGLSCSDQLAALESPDATQHSLYRTNKQSLTKITPRGVAAVYLQAWASSHAGD